jgi:exonuclease III
MIKPLRIVSWNMAKSSEAWALLQAAGGPDVALLQEAIPHNDECITTVPGLGEDWTTGGGRRNFCAAVACFNNDIRFTPIPSVPLAEVGKGKLGVSRHGSLRAATIESQGESPITVVSWYAAWEKDVEQKWPYADASVHRLISDLSQLISTQTGHRIIVAGDINILHGYGESGNRYWGERYASVFSRMEAIGVPFVGPQAPNGKQPSPLPVEMPKGCLDVPTFRTKRSNSLTATRQMDFVFASKSLHPRLKVTAFNSEDEWGPSDHCRVLIELS